MNDTAADRDLITYRWAGFTLQAGMYASFLAMGLGIVWWLLTGAPGGSGLASKVLPFDRLLPELFAGNPLALVNLGVLLLLAAPGFSLLVVIITYAASRN